MRALLTALILVVFAMEAAATSVILPPRVAPPDDPTLEAFPILPFAHFRVSPEHLWALAGQYGLDKLPLLTSAVRDCAGFFGMEPDAFQAEALKVKFVTGAVIGVDPKTQKAAWLVAADLSGAARMRAAVEKKLAAMTEVIPAGAGWTIRASRDGGLAGAIVGDIFLIGNNSGEVQAAIARLRDGTLPNLHIRRVTTGGEDMPVEWNINLGEIRDWLAKAEGKNDDFAALDALLGLKTLESLSGSIQNPMGYTAEGKEAGRLLFIQLGLGWRGENRTMEALRMRPVAKREAAKFFSIDWGLTVFGAPTDAAAQAKSLKDILKRFCDIDGDKRLVDGPERIETLLGVKLEDGLAGMKEFGVGIRVGEQGETQWLVALRLQDAALAELLAKRANQVRQEGGWAAAAEGGVLLLASGDAPIEVARATAKAGHCILDERTAKDVVDYDSAMIALLNPLGFLPPMPRNPYAPPPALVGAELKQQLDPKDHQGFLGLEIYPSPVRGLVKTLQRLLSLQ